MTRIVKSWAIKEAVMPQSMKEVVIYFIQLYDAKAIIHLNASKGKFSLVTMR